MKRYICERRGSATLNCPSGTKLHIHYANYGRLVPGSKVCPDRSIHNISCKNANSMSIVTGACEDNVSCTLFASNSIFGDPCPGTYKYLELHYSCECWPYGNR